MDNRCLRNAFICHCTVVHVLDSLLQLGQAEQQTSTSRKHGVLHVRNTILICPLLTIDPSVVGKIGAFGEDEQPHGVEVCGARHGAFVTRAELPQSILKPLFVGSPFSREEDEAVEHHAGAEDGDVFYRLFEDDVKVAVHSRSVGSPPEVDPVRVYLLRVSIRRGEEVQKDGPGGLLSKPCAPESCTRRYRPHSASAAPSYFRRR
jgi:hypothetical protein